jgi:hypothetical protein
MLDSLLCTLEKANLEIANKHKVMANFYHDFANGFDSLSERTEKILEENLKIVGQKKIENEDYVPDRFEEAVGNIWTAEANRKLEIEGYRNFIEASVVPLLKES